jgi:hypothetical protein
MSKSGAPTGKKNYIRNIKKHQKSLREDPDHLSTTFILSLIEKNGRY